MFTLSRFSVGVSFPLDSGETEKGDEIPVNFATKISWNGCWKLGMKFLRFWSSLLSCNGNHFRSSYIANALKGVNWFSFLGFWKIISKHFLNVLHRKKTFWYSSPALQLQVGTMVPTLTVGTNALLSQLTYNYPSAFGQSFQGRHTTYHHCPCQGNGPTARTSQEQKGRQPGTNCTHRPNRSPAVSTLSQTLVDLGILLLSNPC